MKKRYIALIIIGTVLFILFIFLGVLGSFDFTRSKRLGKTNYTLREDVSSFVGLYYRYPNDISVGVVEGHIPDAYWNEQYILVTQYYGRNDSIEGYYIVKMLPPVDKGVPWEETRFATKEEYEQKKQELSLNEKEMKHITFK
jgi:hypothetical protein